MSTPWEVWKTVLHPGRIVVPGRNGPVSYTFKPNDVANIERNGNAKIADKWRIPVCWEHQDVTPVRLSQGELAKRFAQGVFGDAGKFRTHDGRLQVLLQGDDQKDYDQFKKVKFVSPEIQWDWMDSDGKVWSGPTITHIAATPRPVQRDQEAVGLLRLSFQAAPSLATFFSALPKSTRVAGTLRLSLANYEGNLMADESEDDPLFKSGGAGKKQSPWQKIAASLAEHCGLDLGDVSAINDPEQFAMIVDVAAKNYKAGQEPEPDPEDELLPDDEMQDEMMQDAAPPPDGTATPPPPVQMSLKSAKDQIAKRDERLIALERDKLIIRARRVAKSGALTPADGDTLVSKMETVRLSLTAAGELQRNESIIELEALERVKPGTTWSRSGKKPAVRMSQRSRPVDDSEYATPPTKSDKQVLDEWDATGK